METTYKVREKELQDSLAIYEKEVCERKDELNKELQSLVDARSAAIEAARKEREVTDNPQLYTLPLLDDEIHDIEYLNGIRGKMRYPAVIGKVIWSSFIQKKVNPFIAKIIGANTICGIYKITNQLTQESYIGQSLDIQKR